MDLTALDWTLLVVASLVIGIAKTGFPGIGILAVALTATAVPGKATTGLILPMLIVGDIVAVAYYRRHAVWKHLVKLIPLAMVGVLGGVFALKYVDERQFTPIIGGAVLVMIFLSYLRSRRKDEDLKIPQGWWFPVTMGLTAGVATMMFNAAGPIMVIYLLAMKLPKREFIGTGAWYYLLVNCFKIPFSGTLGLINVDSLVVDAFLVPVILLGAFLGIKLVKVVPERGFKRVVQFLAAAAAAQLVLSPWLPWKKPPPEPKDPPTTATAMAESRDEPYSL